MLRFYGYVICCFLLLDDWGSVVLLEDYCTIRLFLQILTNSTVRVDISIVLYMDDTFLMRPPSCRILARASCCRIVLKHVLYVNDATRRVIPIIMQRTPEYECMVWFCSFKLSFFYMRIIAVSHHLIASPWKTKIRCQLCMQSSKALNTDNAVCSNWLLIQYPLLLRCDNSLHHHLTVCASFIRERLILFIPKPIHNLSCLVVLPKPL
jgi:hypothetical protein